MKNKKILYILILIVSIISFSNCSKEGNPVNNNNSFNEIFPIAVGNVWKYHITGYDTSGNVVLDFVSSDSIKADTIINNTRWYYTDKNSLYYSVFPDGYYTYDQYQSDSNKISLTYKYPCNKNDNYSYWTVANIDTQITVSMKTYNCILYKYRMKTKSNFSYYDVYIQPGVGKIKSVDYGYIPNRPIFIQIISELVDYRLK